MKNLSIAQLFGEGSYQDATKIVILKNSLPTLTPSNTNTAESLLVAMLLKAIANFEDSLETTTGVLVTDENNNNITIGTSDAYELLKMVRWKPFGIQRLNQTYISNQIILQIYTPNATN